VTKTSSIKRAASTECNELVKAVEFITNKLKGGLSVNCKLKMLLAKGKEGMCYN